MVGPLCEYKLKMTMKNNYTSKPSQWKELRVVHLVFYLVWKEKWQRKRLYLRLMGCGEWSNWSGTWKENNSMTEINGVRNRSMEQ